MINLNTKIKVDPKEVIWVEGHINYSKVYLINQKPIVVAQTLKKVLEKLDSNEFCRIHKGQVINLALLSAFKSTSEGLVFQNNFLPISRRMKGDFVRRSKVFVQSEF
jgi:two-component system, LytTR family, response regulator